MGKKDHWGLDYTDLLNAAKDAKFIEGWYTEVYTDTLLVKRCRLYTRQQLLYRLADLCQCHHCGSPPEALEKFLSLMEKASESVEWWDIKPWVPLI